MGLFSSIGDFVGDVAKVATAPLSGVDNLLKGDFEGAFTEPFENAWDGLKDSVESFGKLAKDLDFIGLGQVFSELDDFLDENPWLKGVISAVAPLYGSAAIAAIDIASEINEGDLTIEDFARGGVEFGMNYAGGRLAGMAGGGGLDATQIATKVLGESGVLGEDSSKIATAAGILAGGDFSSAAGAFNTAIEAVDASDALGENEKYLKAFKTIYNGDYGSGVEAYKTVSRALDETDLLGDNEKYLRVGSAIVEGDYSSAGGIFETAKEAADEAGVLDGIAPYVDAGERVYDFLDGDRELAMGGSDAVVVPNGDPR